MSNLLSFNYWFLAQPAMFVSWAGTVLLVVFTALAVVGLVAKIYGVRAGLDKFVRRAVQRAGTCLLSMGLVGLLHYFFVFERVPVLSMRIWLLVWLVAILLWAWSILRYVRVEIPKANAMKAERERLNKWLPKAKR